MPTPELTVETCPKYLQQIISNLKAAFRTTGELIPTLVAIKEGNFSAVPIGPMLECGKSKNALARMMMALARNPGCEAVCLISEVWMIEAKPEKMERLKRIALDNDLHKHPGRKLVLNINYNEPDLTVGAFANIKARQRKLHGWWFNSFTAAEYAEFCKTTGVPQARFSNVFAQAQE